VKKFDREKLTIGGKTCFSKSNGQAEQIATGQIIGHVQVHIKMTL
jgi:hypothetical protein